MRNLYTLLRTETADSCLRKIVLFIAEKFGNETALDRLDRIEREISILAENPYAGIDPRYMVLRRQGFKVLILEKDLVFYKINEAEKIVTIYAITDQRQDYLKSNYRSASGLSENPQRSVNVYESKTGPSALSVQRGLFFSCDTARAGETGDGSLSPDFLLERRQRTVPCPPSWSNRRSLPGAIF